MNPDKTNPPPPTFIPGNFPTIRVNAFNVLLGGSDFTLSFSENRQVVLEDRTVSWATVEVGRFVVDAVSMAAFRQQIDRAIKNHEAILGQSLPDPEAFMRKLKAEAAAEQLENQMRMPPGQSPK